MSIVHNLIIIGSGPAGYTAALYAKRANIDVCLINGDRPGGQLMITTEVENWPGGKENLQGPELMDNMYNQLKRLNVKIIQDHIIQANLQNNTLTGREYKYKYKALIIATGANAKYLGIPSEQEFMGLGVSACATCDGFFYKNKTVAVIGGGNTAVEEALYLSNIAHTVYLVHRRDKLRAEKILQDRLFKTNNIKIFWNSELDEVIGNEEKGVTNMKIKKDNITTILNVDGIFIAIGHTPNTGIFKELEMKNGYINVLSGQNGYSTMTSMTNVFACGDVTDSVYRQAITSAGEGCKAALDAEKYLSGLE